MADIIKMPGLEDKKDDNFFQVEYGFNIPLNSMIVDYYEHARGIGRDDTFVVKYYPLNQEESKTLLVGSIDPEHMTDNWLTPKRPQREESSETNIGKYQQVFVRQQKESEILDEQSKSALKTILEEPYSVVSWSDESDKGTACVFVGCNDGIMGCCWYDCTKIPVRALKMSAFILYAFGYINATTDKTLYIVTYHCLPYTSHLGRSDLAEKIIIDAILKEKAKRLT